MFNISISYHEIKKLVQNRRHKGDQRGQIDRMRSFERIADVMPGRRGGGRGGRTRLYQTLDLRE